MRKAIKTAATSTNTVNPPITILAVDMVGVTVLGLFSEEAFAASMLLVVEGVLVTSFVVQAAEVVVALVVVEGASVDFPVVVVEVVVVVEGRIQPAEPAAMHPKSPQVLSQGYTNQPAHVKRIGHEQCHTANDTLQRSLSVKVLSGQLETHSLVC